MGVVDKMWRRGNSPINWHWWPVHTVLQRHGSLWKSVKTISCNLSNSITFSVITEKKNSQDKRAKNDSKICTVWSVHHTIQCMLMGRFMNEWQSLKYKANDFFYWKKKILKANKSLPFNNFFIKISCKCSHDEAVV